ncbi:hypothetical protein Kisp01_35970 [Kineosporia sp. NBRC 101677]|nr:hypothetical protein Kisp01_35970 [Kineosporia sp. NBRC 101677]
MHALGDLGSHAPLWVLTQGAVAAAGGEAPSNPVQAQAWGLGRTVGVEHPDRWGGLVDLPGTLDAKAIERLGAVLSGAEDQVAIRAGGVLVRRLKRAGAARASVPGRDWNRGSVLVTGASGAIGPDLASWLVEEQVPHVVLASRRGANTPGASFLASMLAESGADVTMVAVDVTDKAALADVIRWIPRVAPPLSAVVHGAVAVELMPVDQADNDQLAMAFGAKVIGAQNLDELTADLDLGAFVLFSSITATWGVGEHATYAAANAHLDALAENRRARGLPATSVAWGVWGSGGRFSDDADGNELDRPQSLVPERLRRQGLRLLDPQRALGLLGQLLAEDETVMAVADVDWPRFSAVFNAVRSWPLLDGIPEARQVTSGNESKAVMVSGDGAALLEKITGVSAAQRERIVTDLVSGHAAAVLGFASASDVDPARAFREMGFDSLTAVELRTRLNEATGLQLPSTVVFDYPSPVVLARQIIAQLTGNPAAATQSRVAQVDAEDPVVIVGLGCRYPGAENPDGLWRLLIEGGDAIGTFPSDRGWDIAGLLDSIPGQERSSYTSEGGFITGAADFDPAFFRISPREALAMDPQQRLLLETSWEALEHAGIDPVSLQGSLTGVFAGAASSGYASQTGFGADLDGAEGHLLTGNVTSVISGRISYTLGLEGPAVTVDTACSSALVSLHLAAQALRAGECDLALAGGVMIIADPAEFIGFSQQGALARDGRCKAFSAEADGMGLSEGAGMIVLERLSDARRNGHPVLATVAGSAINQDGASNGLSAPNGPSQQRVIRAALASAGLTPADVDVVEAHGTGTVLGDPIEAQALLATYGAERGDAGPLWLGAVKSNIGHAQQASGAAGIIKMVLALKNGRLPATLHAGTPSPHVDWSAGEVSLLTESVEWGATEGRTRRAGVSAFGISGTNAHIILAEAPAEDAVASPDADATNNPGHADELTGVLEGEPAWLISSQTPAGLADQAQRLLAHLGTHPELDPVDVGWSLATTRSTFEHRAVVTGADLLSGLRALAAGEPDPGVVAGNVGGSGQVVFVFPGQGSQWIGMGRALAAASPVFASRLAECGAALAPFVDWSLEEVLGDEEALQRVDVVQPVLWAVMVSLAEFWQAAGVTPDAVLGHSQGEIAAAVVAGILSLEDGARVVALRSQALKALAGRGGMLSIAEPVEVVQRRLSGDVTVAAVNGPNATVVSGDPAVLEVLAAQVETEGGRARMLPVDYASHGPQVDELKEEIERLLAPVSPQAGLVPLVSAMTGEFLAGPEMDAGYWYSSLRAPVEFARATEVLGRAGYRVFIEASAHPVLTAPIADTLESLEGLEIEPVVTGTLRREDGGADRAIASLAAAHVKGVFVDWTAVLPTGRRVELPTYAFQKQRFWPKHNPLAQPAQDDAAVADSAFWNAVEGGDVDGLAQSLAVDGANLAEILPALAAWRRKERGESEVADWRYRITWTPVVAKAQSKLSGIWLLVVPAHTSTGTDSATEAPTSSGLLFDVEAALGERGAHVVRVEVPAGRSARSELGDHLATATSTFFADQTAWPEGVPAVSGVVSLLALDDRPLPDAPVVPTGLASTTALVQALGDAAIEAPLWVLTQGAVAAAAGESAHNPLQAQTWALGRVAGLEHPSRWGGLIDLPATLDARAADRLATVLNGDEDQVAVRAGGVLARRLVRAPRPQTSHIWKPDGTVLITGGTGGVGGHLARWLVTRGAQKVVLSSRSGARVGSVPALAAELAAAGTEVSVVAGDIADRAQVQNLVRWIGENGPQLSSVMHAAGAGVAGPVEIMTPADLNEASLAKVGGAQVLDEVTAGLDLDAFVLFSSGATTWGSGQLSAYAAANAALDALVEDRRARGLTGTSVAWGLWGGGGMGKGTAGEVLQRLGLREMDPDKAVLALAQILDAGESLVAVSDTDWTRFAPVFTVQRPSPLLADLPDAQKALEAAGGTEDAGVARSALDQKLAGRARNEQERILTELVRSEAAAALGHASIDAVPASRAFRELGFDSLTAVDLRTRLNTATGMKLPATLVFDYPTAAAVTQLLLSELLGDLSAPSQARVTAAFDDGEPIAVVGMACRYPGGVSDPESYWEMLVSGTDAIAAFPTDRGWDVDGVYGGGGKSTPKQGGFVYDATSFDASFFGISPREALAMDPQQRLLLETTWEALERAGIDPFSLRGSQTGVFAGATYSAYGNAIADNPATAGYMLTGNAGAVISGRISYTLGLEGPAVTIDTACSSSLVATHLAGQALRAGECDLALASGVTVMATPGAFAEFARQDGLAFDGRCKSFGADADGTGWGEGSGVLVLERLSDARRNGHRVLALVSGSAVNQDGASNGLTAPNGPSQQRVIRAALASAGIEPKDVDAVEAHGTGTVLGDPIEAQAVLATYGAERAGAGALHLGSVKSNIGHTQAAAGVAGIIKMILALQHDRLPQTLFAEQPSPHVDWSAGEVSLLTESVAWETEHGRPRRAGVSAFGVSGTNAHVIIEEAPAPEPAAEPAEFAEPEPSGLPVLDPAPQAWLVSGRSGAGLLAQAGRLAQHLSVETELDPADVGWSLAATRSQFEHRAVVLGDALVQGLSDLAAGAPSSDVVRGVTPVGDSARVGFLFAGQGAQRAGMGRELYASSPVFAETFDHVCALLEAETGVPVGEVVLSATEGPRADQTLYAQTGLFAVELGLVALLEAAGIRPDVVAGHSLGEISAAHVAGVLSLQDACRLVGARARLMQALPEGGAMAAIAVTEDEIRAYVAGIDGLSVAAVNGPTSVVVSGDQDAVEQAVEHWREQGKRVRRLRVSHAFHSARMNPALDELGQVAENISHSAPSVSWVGALTGQAVDAPEPQYWVAQAREAVRFADAVRTMAARGVTVFVEIGPDGTLSAMGSGVLPTDSAAPQFVPVLRPDSASAPSVLRALARAHVNGVEVDWSRVLPTGGPVHLPTYAFQRERFWPDAPALPAQRTGSSTPGEDRFWAAVQGGDLAGLAGALDVDGDRPFSEVLPALASWRAREMEESRTAGWRLRVSWSPLAEPASVRLSGAWLVLAPAGPLDELVAGCVQALESRGASVVLVRASAEPTQPETLAASIRESLTQASVTMPSGVLSLLALDETPLAEAPSVTAGLAATAILVQALGALSFQIPVWVATTGAVSTGPADPLTRPELAQVWGLGLVAGLEHPEHWGGLIDLPENLDERSASRLAAVLAGQVAGEDQIAVRGSGVLGRRLVPAAPVAEKAQQWTSVGSALITGGTGSVGGHVATWLTGRGVPRIVLVSRSGAGSRGIAQRVAELAQQGSGVAVLAVNMASTEQVSGALDWIDRTGPALRAVFHASGVSQGAPVIATDVAELAKAADAKTAGARNLDRLTTHRDLDAFVVFSSGAAIWGSRLQAAYGAANAYLDAIAENRHHRGLPATSVSWGLWGGGGMGDSEGGAQLQRLGLREMDPEQAINALAAVLDHGERLLTVADVDWAKFAPVFTLHRPSALISELPEVARALAAGPTSSGGGSEALATTELGQQLQTLDRDGQERLLVDLVRSAAAGVLGHASADAVDAARPFRELGFDSLTAVELRNQLGAATGLDLPATLVFDYPTPALLGEFLTDELVGAVAAQVSVVSAANTDEPIAIVGMSCRLPGGSNSLPEFWDLLRTGADGITAFPTDRGWEAYVTEEQQNSQFAPVGGFVYDSGDFDPAFFGISPREAQAMDPQQRVLLETVWEALEQAGIDPNTLRGTSAGVFTGAWSSGYGMSLQPGAPQVEAAEMAGGGTEGYFLTGSATSVISGRVAYTLGLEGPAVTIDTACSSSLVALHLAAQSLRSGESSLALAGGVTVMATPGSFAEFALQNGLSGDGRCKSFGADADGTGWGEGSGMLVLERLSDARRNGHRVLALVSGSAVNQDGTSNGLTAPNGPSQQRVIRAALASAGIEAQDVDAVEAHGTGTVLGDPIEAQALLATYGAARDAADPLWLGSVKSNIGHTQAAAGVAGVIKMVLAMQHDLLPLSLHSDEVSPHVDWSSGGVRVLNQPVPWPSSAHRPRRAGVSSFGVSGTNAHIILQEAPALEVPADEFDEPDRGVKVFDDAAPAAWLISARTAEALAGQAGRLASLTETASPADVAWSLATTRARFDHRAVVIGSPASGLAALASGLPVPEVVSGQVISGDKRVVFVFPGQGSQWLGMGCDLAATSPVFAARLAECERALSPYVDWKLSEALDGPLEQVDVLQPVLWAVHVSLAAVWEAAGVRPSAVVGHSQGEIAAAVVSGALSLEDGARVVALRSQALKALSGRGGMLSIAEPVAVVEARLSGDVTVAAVNGPSATVVSGDPVRLAELLAEVEGEGGRARMLPVDYASHGPQVEELREEILRLLAEVRPQVARIPMVSAMTGLKLEGTELTAQYWYDSLRGRVEFSRAVEALADHGVFVESSAHPVLTTPVTEILEALGEPVVTGTLRRDDGGAERMLASLATLHVRGVPVDWTAVLPEGERVDLPTYAFEHRRYWSKAMQAGAGDVRSAGLGAVGHPLLSASVELAGGDGVVVTGRVSLRTHPWLADHAVGGAVLLPGTAFVDLAMRAGYEVGCARVVELTLAAPLVLPPSGAVAVQVVVGAADADDQRTVDIYSRPDDAAGEPWTQHATGRLAPDTRVGLPSAGDFLIWPPLDAEPVDVSDLYEIQAAGGYGYGPVFQGLRAAWRKDEAIFAEIALPESAGADAARFGIHPALLDSSLHAAGLLASASEEGVRLPFAWTGVSLMAAGASSLRVRLAQDEAGGLTLTGADPTGRPVVAVESLILRAVSADALNAAQGSLSNSLFAVDWVPVNGGSAELPTRWALLGEDHFAVSDALPGDGLHVADLSALAEAVADGAAAPELVVITLSGNGSSADAPDESELGSRTRSVTAEALSLVQQWLTLDALADARLALVTRGAVAAADGDGVDDLAASAVWGLVRSAQSENPDRLILLDLPAVSDNRPTPSLAPTLPGEETREDGSAVEAEDGVGAALVSALASGEPEVALRGGVALSRRLVRPASVQVGETGETGQVGESGESGESGRASEVGEVGAVLITGGTGLLGALVARHLAERGRAEELVLISRSGPRAAGVAALAAEVAQSGVAVQVTAADAADRSGLASVLKPLAPRLTGVIHTAGVLDDGVIGSLTSGRLDQVMRPKTDAAWNLHELTANSPLQQFVLFSSGAATFGSPGQGNYAAGNAFLDALAAHRQAAGLPGQSLAWGLWADASAMTGHLNEADRQRNNRSVMSELSTQEGLALMDASLARPEALLVPAKVNVAGLRAQAARGGRFAPVWHALAGRPVGAAPTVDPQAGRLLRAQLNAVADPDRDRVLLSLVRTHGAAVLGHSSADAVGAQKAFNELGFDSLTALELRNRLNAATGLKLPATLVFDYPTPAALAGHLKEQLVDGNDEQADSGALALAEVGRLEEMARAIKAGDGSRSALAARLKALVLTLETEQDPKAEGGADTDLRAATVENIFDLLDNELAD